MSYNRQPLDKPPMTDQSTLNMPYFIDWRSAKPTPNGLKKKVILVTGAADGIGRAITLALAEQGAQVLMLDRKSRHLEKLFDSIDERGFVKPVILPIDLMEITPDSATILAQAVQDEFGRLDGLLHNAAELGSLSPLDQYDIEYWNQVMQTNLQAPYILTRALLPLLKQACQTNILFTSAEAGRQPQAYWGAYSIAYAGLEAQMTIWAEELEAVSNVRVNSVDPGPVRTSLRRRSHPGENQQSLISPVDLASAYLMLLENRDGLHGQKICLQNQIQASH